LAGESTMSLASITFSGIFWHRLVVIDVAILFVFTVLQYLSLRPLNKRDSDADSVRGAAASSMGVAAGAGISAVGILVPLTLLTVQRIVSGDAPLRFRITEDLFVSECWFALSLALGLLVLWFVAFKAPTRNVTRTGYISLTFSIQLLALLIGIVRVLIATFNLIGG
jgi:hypothetical protein